MISKLLSASSLLLAVAGSISPANGACGQGKTPSYLNIDEIRYARTGCFGKCPNYEVLFANSGECYYVGRENVPKHGTYDAACTATTLKDAIAMLERHQFYNLNYDPSIIVTDAPHYIISVERCGVTTTLDWQLHVREDRNDIKALFDGLDLITDRVRWHKVSNRLTSPLPLLVPIP
jgi:hypothetical protein